MAVTAGPYTDSSAQLIESLTREVEYLRLVVSRTWNATSPDAAPAPARRSPSTDTFQAAG